MLGVAFPFLSRKKSGGGGGPSPPAEWAGLTPWLDWDPAVSATADGSGDLTALLDTSGNARHGALAAPGVYPFSTLPPPKVITSSAFGGGIATLEFRGNPNVDSLAPCVVLPDLPAGPITIGLVMFSDMPDHGLMVGGGGAGNFTNNYALSCAGDALGIYADGAASRAFGGWLDSGYGEPARAVDFASTPTVHLRSASGETPPGANDSTTRLYAKSLTPTVIGARTTFAGGAALIGSYQGGMTYVLQGEIARVLVWNAELTSGVQTTAAINALASKYSLSVAP
jgi:hypothetical protein